MRASAVALVALLAGAGCQTFIGIEDANQHLPRLDGNYLVGLERTRADNTTRDVIRMQGTATLDVDNRLLDLSLNILSTTGAPITETSISDIAFADDLDEAEFTLNLAVPAGAIAASPPPAPADLNINVPVRFIAEADYSFCAKPTSAQVVTIGSVLVETFTALPAITDDDCDDPLRD